MSTKDEVLRRLEENRGTPVSGEALAAELGLSRASVWKAVSELRKDGYAITAATNRGYALSRENDLLSVSGLRPWLSPQVRPEHIHLFAELESTNLTAKQMVLDGAPSGTVVLAEQQTKGRGRLGRSFYSPPGGSIYVSFILKPTPMLSRTQLITIGAAVAVSRAVETLTEHRCDIKWVNDVFVEGRKICGILTEGVVDLESGRIESMVLGIGVNVNMPPEAFPEEIRDVAGSIRLPAGRRNQFAARLINEILAIHGELNDRSFLEEYRSRIFVIGREINILRGEEKKEAVATGINDDGNLLVRYPDGREDALSSGEISIRLRTP